MQKRIPLYKWMVELNFAIFNDKSDRFFTLSKIKVRDIIKIIFIGFGVTEDRGQENAYS